MAILLNNLKAQPKIDNKYIFKDLQLDLQQQYTNQKFFNSIQEVTDLKAIYDISAIANSLYRLFTTMIGQCPLNPPYGLNLTQYLFQPLSQSIAQIIAETILKGINQFEPRVNVIGINVNVNFDNSEYEIDLKIASPYVNLGQPFSLKGLLSQSGYYYA